MADKPFLSLSGLSEVWAAIKSKFQEKLVSGTNIKTINNSSILGSGNINITSGVSGVKGDAEQSYRTGNVNLTPANLGAVNRRVAFVGQSSSTTTNPWYKVAEVTLVRSWQDVDAVFLVVDTYGTQSWGILRVHARRTDKKMESLNSTYAKWLVNHNFNPNDFVLVSTKIGLETTPLKVELWKRCFTAYSTTRFVILHEGDKDVDLEEAWTLYKTCSAGSQANYTTGENYQAIPSILDAISVGKTYGPNGLIDHRQLTQSQYDALSSAEKNDGTVYFITDGTAEDVLVNDSVPIGAIQAYAGTTAPTGWIMCNGQAVSRSSYSELFATIGTTYGPGDGSTTFNVPDLRGRVITGVGTADGVSYTLGQKVDAGLPNITGRISPPINTAWQSCFENDGSARAYDAFQKTTWGTRSGFPDAGPYSSVSDFRFDASDSDAHYGASDTVQPNTVVTNYIIKAKDFSLAYARYDAVYNQAVQTALGTMHPVGSYYETSDASFNPNTAWGGSWIQEIVVDDHIIEEGTSDIWQYRKWASGVAECWGIKSLTGSGTERNYTITLPFSLLTTPQYSGTLGIDDCGYGYNNNANSNIGINNKTATNFKICLKCGSSGSSWTYTGNIHIKGLWKAYTAPSTKYKWHRTA